MYQFGYKAEQANSGFTKGRLAVWLDGDGPFPLSLDEETRSAYGTIIGCTDMQARCSTDGVPRSSGAYGEGDAARIVPNRHTACIAANGNGADLRKVFAVPRGLANHRETDEEIKGGGAHGTYGNRSLRAPWRNRCIRDRGFRRRPGIISIDFPKRIVV